MSPRIRTEDYIRPSTAARLAGLNRSRIDQLLAGGELAFVEIDGIRHIHRRDAERLAKAVAKRRAGAG